MNNKNKNRLKRMEDRMEHQRDAFAETIAAAIGSLSEPDQKTIETTTWRNLHSNHKPVWERLDLALKSASKTIDWSIAADDLLL